MLEAYGSALATLFEPINLLILLAAVLIGLIMKPKNLLIILKRMAYPVMKSTVFWKIKMEICG